MAVTVEGYAFHDLQNGLLLRHIFCQQNKNICLLPRLPILSHRSGKFKYAKTDFVVNTQDFPIATKGFHSHVSRQQWIRVLIFFNT